MAFSLARCCIISNYLPFVSLKIIPRDSALRNFVSMKEQCPAAVLFLLSNLYTLQQYAGAEYTCNVARRSSLRRGRAFMCLCIRMYTYIIHSRYVYVYCTLARARESGSFGPTIWRIRGFGRSSFIRRVWRLINDRPYHCFNYPPLQRNNPAIRVSRHLHIVYISFNYKRRRGSLPRLAPDGRR